VHHPMPLFHMEHCVYAALLSEGRDHLTCGRPCEHRKISLKDRAGMSHPVEADVGCRNTVFHAAAAERGAARAGAPAVGGPEVPDRAGAGGRGGDGAPGGDLPGAAPGGGAGGGVAAAPGGGGLRGGARVPAGGLSPALRSRSFPSRWSCSFSLAPSSTSPSSPSPSASRGRPGRWRGASRASVSRSTSRASAGSRSSVIGASPGRRLRWFAIASIPSPPTASWRSWMAEGGASRCPPRCWILSAISQPS
jgi:hypothetical protein